MALKTSLKKREHTTFKNRHKKGFSAGTDAGSTPRSGRAANRSVRQGSKGSAESTREKSQVQQRSVMWTRITPPGKEENCISFPFQAFLDSTSLT